MTHAHLCAAATLAIALTSVGFAAQPNEVDAETISRHGTTDHSADSFKIWYKVYVNELGVPQTVEILKMRPQMQLDATAREKLIVPIRGWTLTPNSKAGKPMAGPVVVVVDYN